MKIQDNVFNININITAGAILLVGTFAYLIG